MARKLAFVHTVTPVIGLFSDLAREILPANVEILHIVDEMLARIVVAQGRLSPFIYRRVADHAIAAEQAGATAVQLTCSSISPCVDVVRSLVSVPVLKVDEPMVDRALSLGTRIAVAATAQTALTPVADLARAKAAAAGRRVQVSGALCEGAYEALFSGDPELHDRIVSQTLVELMAESDVVLLAQASMARVAGALPAEKQWVPILSSPRLAMERVRELLD